MPKTHDNYHWSSRFLALLDHCIERYRGGNGEWSDYYTEADLEFLFEIGYKPRELFDFVEDQVDVGEPTREDALLIAAVRRDYLREIQKGEHSDYEMKPDELPPRDAELGGIVWLPRIIRKAENKLRGENDPDIMYSCGGDRKFLRQHDIHPADFLRLVWAADGDHDRIVAYVREANPDAARV